jgi:hypothetical protein
MRVTFEASIPMIQSAFNVGGDGSARLKLDIPASELAAVVNMMGFARERSVSVTVDTGEDEQSE